MQVLPWVIGGTFCNPGPPPLPQAPQPPLPPPPPPKFALLIGINSYAEEHRIPNALLSACELARRLRALGFKVTYEPEVSHVPMKAALDAFLATLTPGCTAVLYFCGHGWQSGVAGDCLLLPSDFDWVEPSGACPVRSRLRRVNWVVVQRCISVALCQHSILLTLCADTCVSLGDWLGRARLAMGPGPPGSSSAVPSSPGQLCVILDALNEAPVSPLTPDHHKVLHCTVLWPHEDPWCVISSILLSACSYSWVSLKFLRFVAHTGCIARSHQRRGPRDVCQKTNPPDCVQHC